MMYSSSIILVKVFDIMLDQELNNVRKLEDDLFLSLTFYDEKKELGEIHWSKSFQHGKMNLLNFARVEDVFVLFTSNLATNQYLVNSLRCMLKREVYFDVLKVPTQAVPTTTLFEEIDDLVHVKFEPFISVQLSFKYSGKLVYMTAYANGVITYTMTNDMELIRRIIQITMQLKKMVSGGEHD